jgi:hypothetical protein
MCSGSGSYKTVGSLVLLPDGSDNPTVDVLIAAGVQRDETDDTANSMTAGQCAGLVFEGSSIEGAALHHRAQAPHLRRPQVATAPDRARQGVYRRRLRGPTLTCYRGNCVSPDISCPPDQAECAAPKGCDEECEELCGSGTGGCVDGECAPLRSLRPGRVRWQAVRGRRGRFVRRRGVLRVRVCLRPRPRARRPAAPATARSASRPRAPRRSAPGPVAPAASGRASASTWTGSLRACAWAPATTSCAGASECPDAGQEPDCTTIPRGEACVCSCDDTACEGRLRIGLRRVRGGARAAARRPCSLSDCGACIKGEIPQCAETCGGCDCVCNNDECSADCVAEGGQRRRHVRQRRRLRLHPDLGQRRRRATAPACRRAAAGFGASQPSGGGGYGGANGGGGFGASEPSGGGGMGGG